MIDHLSLKMRFALLAAGLLATGQGALWPGVGQAEAAYSTPNSPYADLAAVDAQVSGFLGHGIGQNGGAATPVDRRLRLNACRSPLALSWRGNRRDTVLVECPDAGSWRLFVPVRQAEANGTVTGGNVAIARGEQVTIAVIGEGFSVSQPGEAMDSGSLGEWIRVRGVKNGTPQGEAMRAQITRPGEVSVAIRD